MAAAADEGKQGSLFHYGSGPVAGKIYYTTRR
jgi:hypothetical protein